MRKFLQWSLVTLVAIVLLAAVVGQILAKSTGRAREASVAVLKEKLARLEAERAAAAPVAVFDVAPGAGSVPSLAAMDEDALRARWLALFDSMVEVDEACGNSEAIMDASTRQVIDHDAPVLDEKVRAALLTYQTCIEPAMAELQVLRELKPGLGALVNMEDLQANADTYDGIWRLCRILRISYWNDAALGDAAGVIDAFTSISYLAAYGFRGLRYYAWVGGQSGNSIILKPAIADPAVEDVLLDRLYEMLTIHRSLPLFPEEVRRNTEQIVEDFETWGDKPLSSYGFSEDPIGYARGWAYPRLTPALFNYDFDRFNRAMDRLLDLAARPYYEVKEDLERFYSEFDVEPNISSIKFTRTNPGWYYVLTLSRHGFEQNAHEQASMDVIRIAILLDRHRRRTGTYPESLDYLAAAFGGSLPVNPLMGDRYVYERTEDSFRLGFREETDVAIREQGFGPTMVTWWHEPLGVEVEEIVE